MSQTVAEQRSQASRKENEGGVAGASLKSHKGLGSSASNGKLPPVNKAKVVNESLRSQLSLGLLDRNLVNQASQQLPAVLQASEKQLRESLQQGLSEAELHQLIDTVYTYYRDQCRYSQEEQLSADPAAAHPPAPRLKVVRKPLWKMPKTKPFAPAQPFTLVGLILEKMSEYEGLNDPNLIKFLTKPANVEMFVRNGLITEQGLIVKRPNDYLAKKTVYDKIANITEKPIETTGKMASTADNSPYLSLASQFQDYRKRLFKAAKLDQRIVQTQPKKTAQYGKPTMTEEAIARHHQKLKNKKVAPMANLPKSESEFQPEFQTDFTEKNEEEAVKEAVERVEEGERVEEVEVEEGERVEGERVEEEAVEGEGEERVEEVEEVERVEEVEVEEEEVEEVEEGDRAEEEREEVEKAEKESFEAEPEASRSHEQIKDPQNENDFNEL